MISQISGGVLSCCRVRLNFLPLSKSLAMEGLGRRGSVVRGGTGVAGEARKGAASSWVIRGKFCMFCCSSFGVPEVVGSFEEANIFWRG